MYMRLCNNKHLNVVLIQVYNCLPVLTYKFGIHFHPPIRLIYVSGNYVSLL